MCAEIVHAAHQAGAVERHVEAGNAHDGIGTRSPRVRGSLQRRDPGARARHGVLPAGDVVVDHL